MTGPEAHQLEQQLVEDHLVDVPHARALGMRFHALTDEYIELVLPYAPHLVGDPDSGVLHGGAITALLDNAAGFAVRPPSVQRDELSIATLDLRIDYMGPARPGLDVIGRATCFRRTKTIAFVRAIAYHQADGTRPEDSGAEPGELGPDHPIASGTAAFMIGTPNTPQNGADGPGGGR